MNAAHDPRELVSAALQDKVLAGAVAFSVVFHAAVLTVRFVDPEVLRVRSSEPTLDVILVNARGERRPTEAQALAQANLDGGGTHDAGRRSSPLPNSMEWLDGDSLGAAERRLRELEEEQKRLLAQLNSGKTLLAARRPVPGEPGRTETLDATTQRLARMQAEIAEQISDYQKRPRKHHFMPSTSAYRYARYVEDWRARVERIGNEHYPSEARGKHYGKLRLAVAIRRDGSVYEIVLLQSSGSPVLDRAARRIVRMAAPFAPFPPDVARDTDILEITRTWIFTNDRLETRNAQAPAGDAKGASVGTVGKP